MHRLNFGEIMDSNPEWFEDYDLTCPICEGSGEIVKYEVRCENEDCKFQEEYDDECDVPDVCPECGSDEYLETETTEQSCEDCTEGQFEIMWNTAFEVYVPHKGYESSRRTAWEHGFCLIAHDNTHYLLMGSCGADMTWRIHYCRWKIQGYLESGDVTECLGSGAHLMLPSDKRRELCLYFRRLQPSIREYTNRYLDTLRRIDNIMGDEQC